MVSLGFKPGAADESTELRRHPYHTNMFISQDGNSTL